MSTTFPLGRQEERDALRRENEALRRAAARAPDVGFKIEDVLAAQDAGAVTREDIARRILDSDLDRLADPSRPTESPASPRAPATPTQALESPKTPLYTSPATPLYTSPDAGAALGANFSERGSFGGTESRTPPPPVFDRPTRLSMSPPSDSFHSHSRRDSTSSAQASDVGTPPMMSKLVAEDDDDPEHVPRRHSRDSLQSRRDSTTSQASSVGEFIY